MPASRLWISAAVSLLQETEGLKNRRNTVSGDVAKKKKNKEPADDLIAEMRTVSDRIKELDDEVRELEVKIDEPDDEHPEYSA